MLLDDLLDDREAETGPALARRHIGFGDRIARLGQPDAVVGDANDNLTPRTDFERRADMARCDGIGVFIFFFNRFHSRSEEHTSELQSLMRISYAVFCLKK